MKIKVPRQIKVSSMVYDVILTDSLEKDYKLLGQCLTDTGVIKVDSKSKLQVKDATLLHEIIHAISDVYRCDLEESNIERIAHGLADVLKNSFGVEFEW